MNGVGLSPSDDTQYKLLRQLTRDPAASQRNLAMTMGVSVGKINYCLRALMLKGHVKVNNFRRSDNKLAYAYILTPAGIEEKAKLTRKFLQRKLAEFDEIQREINELTVETQEYDTAPSHQPAAGSIGNEPILNSTAPADSASK